MKTCWQILDISQTTDVDIIRRAYLALLPSFHPETDPQGFKQLRQAYEDALRIAHPLLNLFGNQKNMKLQNMKFCSPFVRYSPLIANVFCLPPGSDSFSN
ncbi:DnaJ-class chaperone [Escherichia coli]|uniref:DnaJ-class chaperone n=1 Tax=Escherichia coli TaxID=562 RepID=A0A376VNC4_ECOLX|nr:DnaJ-class chaperone [Escherichia coli]